MNTSDPDPSLCLIGLGGNVGCVENTMREALTLLRQCGCDIVKVSRLWRSVPMGPHAGGPFLNAAAEIRTADDPEDLLRILQGVEYACGRQAGERWGPRTLDLDLLVCGQQVITTDQLTVPHPGLWYRRFVLQPLMEIAPHWRHPVLHRTIVQLFERLECRPLVIDVSAVRVSLSVPDFCSGIVRLDDAHDESSAFCRLISSGLTDSGALSDAAFQIVCSEDLSEQDMLNSVLQAALGDCRVCCGI